MITIDVADTRNHIAASSGDGCCYIGNTDGMLVHRLDAQSGGAEAAQKHTTVRRLMVSRLCKCSRTDKCMSCCVIQQGLVTFLSAQRKHDILWPLAAHQVMQSLVVCRCYLLQVPAIRTAKSFIKMSLAGRPTSGVLQSVACCMMSHYSLAIMQCHKCYHHKIAVLARVEFYCGICVHMAANGLERKFAGTSCHMTTLLDCTVSVTAADDTAPDSGLIAMPCSDGTVQVAAQETYQPLYSVSLADCCESIRLSKLSQVSHAAHKVLAAFSPCGQWLATVGCSQIAEIQIWEAETGQLEAQKWPSKNLVIAVEPIASAWHCAS